MYIHTYITKSFRNKTGTLSLINLGHFYNYFKISNRIAFNTDQIFCKFIGVLCLSAVKEVITEYFA